MDELSFQYSEVLGDDELSVWTEESSFDSAHPSIYESKSSLQTHGSVSMMSEEVVTKCGRPHFLMPQQQQVGLEDDDDAVNMFLQEHSCSESSFDSSSSFDSDTDDDGSSAIFSLHVPRNSGHVSGLSCFDSLSTIYFSEDLDKESSVKDSAHPSCSTNRNVQRSISNSSNKRNLEFSGRIRQSISFNRKLQRSISESSKKSQTTNRVQSSTSSNRKLQRSISESSYDHRPNVESNRKIPLTNRSHLSSSSTAESFRFGAEWMKVLSVESADRARHHSNAAKSSNSRSSP
jgi:hypothetical protein